MTNSQRKVLNEVIDFMNDEPLYINDDYEVLAQYKKDNKYLVYKIGRNGKLTSETYKGYIKNNFYEINKFCWNYRDVLCELKLEEE